LFQLIIKNRLKILKKWLFTTLLFRRKEFNPISATTTTTTAAAAAAAVSGNTWKELGFLYEREKTFPRL